MNSRALGDFRMPILDVPFLSLLQVFVVKPVWLWYVGGWFEHWSKFAAIFPEKVMTMSSDPKPWSFSCLGCFFGDEMLPSHVGIMTNHDKDPHKPTSTMECHKVDGSLLSWCLRKSWLVNFKTRSGRTTSSARCSWSVGSGRQKAPRRGVFLGRSVRASWKHVNLSSWVGRGCYR